MKLVHSLEADTYYNAYFTTKYVKVICVFKQLNADATLTISGWQYVYMHYHKYIDRQDVIILYSAVRESMSMGNRFGVDVYVYEMSDEEVERHIILETI